MVAVNKIDSNVTGLAYAEESSLGVLGGAPVWKRLKPNSYGDFGGENSLTAPNPIDPSRQRLKGVVTDLDASAGINHNLDFFSLQDMLAAALFADIRQKGRQAVTSVAEGTGANDTYLMTDTTGFLVGSLVKGCGFPSSANNGVHEILAVTPNTSVGVAEGALVADAAPPAAAFAQVVGFQTAVGDVDVVVTGDLPALTSTALDFTTLGLVVGQWIFIGGDTSLSQFTTPANNGFKRIRSISANSIVLDKSVQAMVAEANATQTVQLFFGDVLRNETGTMIRRKSFHLERTLGAPNDASPAAVQSEYVRGAVPNEITLNIPAADLVNVDLGFLAIDHTVRTAVQGPLQSGVVEQQSADVFNTTSDFSRIKMSVVSNVSAAPVGLFTFITEGSISINNNMSANKAVGVLGAFDVTAGNFAVSGSVTAYFSDVASVLAVRNNADVTLDMAMVKQNMGIVIDIPLVALGDGRLNVEQDQPIMLPLSAEAATGEKIAPGMNHTMLITFFGYLPTAAE